MPARKMRVELFDGEGNRYSIAFEGQVTREKALRLFDLVELLGGVQATDAVQTSHGGQTASPSKYDKMGMLLQRHFPLVWFSSREVQSVYEHELNEPVTISTVSTYLSRMADKGVLLKMGASNSWKYRLTPNVPQPVVKQQIR
jgi:hypothetical protein